MFAAVAVSELVPSIRTRHDVGVPTNKMLARVADPVRSTVVPSVVIVTLVAALWNMMICAADDVNREAPNREMRHVDDAAPARKMTGWALTCDSTRELPMRETALEVLCSFK